MWHLFPGWCSSGGSPVRHGALVCLALAIGSSGSDWAFSEEEMHGCSFKEVVVQLVDVCDRAYDVGANMSFVIKRLQPPPHFSIVVLLQLAVCSAVGPRVRIDPLLHLHRSRAVVQLVRYIRRLRADIADLAHEGDLGDFGAVDLEVCVGVGLLGIEDLLDGAGAEGVFAVVAFAAWGGGLGTFYEAAACVAALGAVGGGGVGVVIAVVVGWGVLVLRRTAVGELYTHFKALNTARRRVRMGAQEVLSERFLAKRIK